MISDFRRNFRSNSGFSLIELSVILMIVSLLGVACMESYRSWLQGKIAGDTEAHKNLATDALTFFVANYGRLPCPAAPGLAPTDPAAGQEDCLLAVVGNGCANGLCRIDGRRGDVDLDGVTDKVLLGTVPYASLGMSIADGLDGWQNKMTYAVTETMTKAFSYDPAKGVIGFREGTRVAYDPGNPTNPLVGQLLFADIHNKGNTDLGNLPNSFPFVLLSHGEDGRGAWNYNGNRPVPCGTMNVDGWDAPNCDGDALFINADVGTGIYDRHAGPSHFDDPFTVFKISRDNDKWSYSSTTSMKNKTGGKVGIGLPVPGVTLDVGGNILLEDFEAMEYCSPVLDPTPPDPTHPWANCFIPSMVGGSAGMGGAAQCGDITAVPPRPMLMRGVDGAASNKLDCVNTMSTATITPTTCPAGQYMKGINALGGIICQAP